MKKKQNLKSLFKKKTNSDQGLQNEEKSFDDSPKSHAKNDGKSS